MIKMFVSTLHMPQFPKFNGDFWGTGASSYCGSLWHHWASSILVFMLLFSSWQGTAVMTQWFSEDSIFGDILNNRLVVQHKYWWFLILDLNRWLVSFSLITLKMTNLSLFLQKGVCTYFSTKNKPNQTRTLWPNEILGHSLYVCYVYNYCF